MFFCSKNKILIKNLVLLKGYSSRRLIKEFPQKCWNKNGLDVLLRKIRATGGVDCKQGSGRPRSVRTPENINTVQDLVLSQENAPQTHRITRQIDRSSRCCQIFGVCHGTSSYSNRTAHLHTVHGTPSSCYDMKPQTSLDQMSGQRIHQTSIQLTIGSGG